MPLTQNILQAARTQMAVTLSAEKPVEERIDRSGRTLARKRIPYAARRKNRHSRSRNQQKRPATTLSAILLQLTCQNQATTYAPYRNISATAI